MYGNRDEQGQLLQQVLTASDTDADEERIPGEGSKPVSTIHMNLAGMFFKALSANEQ